MQQAEPCGSAGPESLVNRFIGPWPCEQRGREPENVKGPFTVTVVNTSAFTMESKPLIITPTATK
jgi:hypothetical protein